MQGGKSWLPPLSFQPSISQLYAKLMIYHTFTINLAAIFSTFNWNPANNTKVIRAITPPLEASKMALSCENFEVLQQLPFPAVVA